MGRVNIPLPDELHKKAKSKAVLEGESLQDYIIKCVSREVNENSNL